MAIQVAVCAVMVLAIGLIDFVTGVEVSFSIFYLAPVSLAAWFCGRKWAVIISALGALVWLLAELSGGKIYSHSAIGYWNSAVRMGFFISIGVLLARLRETLSTDMESRPSPTTFSAGVITVANPEPSVEELIRQADRLMYDAKREGKDRVKPELAAPRVPGGQKPGALSS